MKRIAWLLIALGACTKSVPTKTPTGGEEDSQSQLQAPVPTLNPAKLPKGFSGEGVLASRSDLPKGAPPWLKVEAEVIKDEEGRRVLIASALADGIANPAMGSTTAGNRARAILARYLTTNPIVGSEIVEQWANKKKGVYGARAKIVLDEPAF